MLTVHQTEKLTEALEILKTNKRLLIKGSAGVGKTFMLHYLIKQCDFPIVHCGAPTNPAVKIMKSKIRSHKVQDFRTLHSYLKLKRRINKRTGKISFVPDYVDKRNEAPLEGVICLIIDESSMINKDILAQIEKNIHPMSTIIFLGDIKQLPPIGEKISEVFTSNYPEIELTEIVRQGEGNPVVDLSRKVMTIKSNKENIVSQLTDDGEPLEGYVYSENRNKIVTELAKANGTDEIKFLAWHRKICKELNDDVRKEIYGTPAKIELGESLVFDTPYGDRYISNEVIKVKSLETAVIKVPHTFLSTQTFGVNETKIVDIKVYCINKEDKVKIGRLDYPKGVLVVHEDSEPMYNAILNDIGKQCNLKLMHWGQYYRFVENFANILYNHALTVHKSQGCTFENTIVDIGDIYLNPDISEKEKMLYTAVTRTSKLLILYNA